MKLLINTASTHKGGGVQVAFSFIHECIKHRANEYHVIIGPSLRDKIITDNFPDNFHFYFINHRPATRVFSLRSTASFFKNLEKQINPDVVFTTSGPAYWRPKAKHLTGFNLGHHIYTDSPFFSIIPAKKKIRWFAKRNIAKYYFKRDSDAFVVQTDDVNQRLDSWLKNNKPIYTVSNTCSHYFYNPYSFPAKLPKKSEGTFRFLLLSAYYRHKNIEIIADIIRNLPLDCKHNIQFVVTLEEEVYHKLFEKPIQKYVLNVGSVKLEEAPSLYQECDALFMPTLLECFSASYAEAMAMKKPIITTDLGFARSICQDAALYYDPLNADDALEKILALKNDAEMQQQLISKGTARLKVFNSPEERASKYLEICQSMYNAE